MADYRAASRRWSAALAARPAVPAAALFIGGIVLHPVLTHRPDLFLLGSAIATATAILFFSKVRASIALIAVALLLGGVAASQIEGFQFPPDHISVFAGDQPRLAQIELDLDQPLRVLGTSFGSARPMPPRQITSARVTRVLTTTGWVVASGRTLVQIDPPNDALSIGQTIRVLGFLQRPSPAMNPGQFDWASYYREQRILTSLQVTHSDGIQIVARGAPSPLARLRQYVRATLAAGFTKAQSLDHALLRALVLGDNDPELRDVQEQFRRTGTSHHLAISGMHVAVLGAVIYWLGHLCMLRPRPIAIIALVAVVLYGVVALPSPPVVRSVVLCASIGLGIMSRRATDAVQLLALSVLAMLVYHPLDLYNAGFQLSFGTVLGLMVLTRRVMPCFADPDAAVAVAAAGQSRPPLRLRVAHKIRRWLAAPLAAGVIAWTISMPLIAYHFEQLNPWAVIASLLLAIPVFFALIGGFAKILLTMLIPGWAGAWATLAAAPVALMRHAVHWLAMLPGSDVPLPGRSISFVVVYYTLLAVPLLPIVRPNLRRGFRFAPVAAILLFALIPLTGGAGPSPRDGALRVTALAVGAGQCCVIELPDGRVILLDAGSATLGDPVHKCILPFLRSRGIATIDEIWLSDCDYDHIAAVSELIRTYEVGRLVIGSDFERDAAGKPADEAMLDTVARYGVSIQRLRRGDHVRLGKEVAVDVLWPPRTPLPQSWPSNNSDLVMKLTYARRTILFPADVQQRAQAELLRNPLELRCDAMLAPHHGSGEATTPAFLAAADPLYIVSSNDRTLTQKQRLFDRQAGDRPLLRTNRCGAVTITIDRTGGLTVVPYLSASPSR